MFYGGRLCVQACHCGRLMCAHLGYADRDLSGSEAWPGSNHQGQQVRRRGARITAHTHTLTQRHTHLHMCAACTGLSLLFNKWRGISHCNGKTGDKALSDKDSITLASCHTRGGEIGFGERFGLARRTLRSAMEKGNLSVEEMI